MYVVVCLISSYVEQDIFVKIWNMPIHARQLMCTIARYFVFQTRIAFLNRHENVNRRTQASNVRRTS